MSCSIDIEYVGVGGMILAERTDAIVAQEFGRIEQTFEQGFHTMTAHEGQETTLTGVGLLPVRHKTCEVGTVGQKPRQVAFEPRQSIEQLRLQCFDSTKWNQAD